MFIVACICNENNSFVVQCVLFLKESAYIRKFCICMGHRTRMCRDWNYTVYEIFCRQFYFVAEKFYDSFINHSVLLKTTGFVNSLQSILETNFGVHNHV